MSEFLESLRANVRHMQQLGRPIKGVRCSKGFYDELKSELEKQGMPAPEGEIITIYTLPVFYDPMLDREGMVARFDYNEDGYL